MIIYQFHMLSDGMIKISKAEYKEAKDRRGNFCYKKVKVLEKGIKHPKFPSNLYKLGEADYNKYYALSIDELEQFVRYKVKIIQERIDILNSQIKEYKKMVSNLNKSE